MKYYISFDSNYEGWIYLIKSSDRILSDTLYPNKSGIVYVPSVIYNDGIKFEVVFGNKFKADGLYNILRSVFYDEKNRETTYSHFYIPLTRKEKEQKVYTFKNEPMREFEYYYYSGIIDTNRILR